MEMLFAQLLSGLATGGIYASLALALVMIYQSTHHVNFAQGEMAMFSTFVAATLIQAGWPYWAAFAATLAFGFVLGAGIERVLLRRMHDAPVLSVVVVFVALLVILHSLAALFFGYTIRTFPSPFPDQPWAGSKLLTLHQLGSIGVTLVLLVVLYVFFKYTTLGLQMRAAALNPVSSRLSGVRVNRMLGLGWGLAGLLGAVAGMLIAPSVFLDVHMMSGVLLYAFAAALLGGIDSPPGAVLGGFIVGMLENLMGTYVVGPELKLTMALVIIVAVLVLRPAGLLGKTVVARV
jgi:branched-chain amino acid transport system permease protein